MAPAQDHPLVVELVFAQLVARVVERTLVAGAALALLTIHVTVQTRVKAWLRVRRRIHVEAKTLEADMGLAVDLDRVPAFPQVVEAALAPELAHVKHLIVEIATTVVRKRTRVLELSTLLHKHQCET